MSNTLEIIHIKRQVLPKIRSREYFKNEQKYKYISRTDLEDLRIKRIEVKETLGSLVVLLVNGVPYYSDVFREYYKSLDKGRKDTLTSWSSFKDGTLSIERPNGSYFIRLWGKITWEDE